MIPSNNNMLPCILTSKDIQSTSTIIEKRALEQTTRLDYLSCMRYRYRFVIAKVYLLIDDCRDEVITYGNVNDGVYCAVL